jgi:hypothetical protein
MKVAFYFGFIILVCLTVLGIVSCLDEDHILQAPKEMSARTGEAVGSPQGAGGPCDSVYYVPVVWGARLKMIPQTIASGNRKGVPWWQGKGYAFSRIDPTNYQQDPLKERVVFGDTLGIGPNDTFYICRKIVK